MISHPGVDSEKATASFNTRIRTLSDYPLLIGELLRRNELRS